MSLGTQIARIGARLLRADTVDLVMSPAIADLQFEGINVTTSRWQLLRAYVGVWRAFGGALSWDLARTLQLATSADHRQSMLAAAGVLASYVSALVLFAADIAAGAEGLSRSAVISNPALRRASLGAITVLLFVAASCLVRKALDSRRAPAPNEGRLSGNLSILCLFFIQHLIENATGGK